MTSAAGLKLLIHHWLMLRCKDLRGELKGGAVAGGTPCALQALVEGFALPTSH